MNLINILSTPFPRPKRTKRNLFWLILLGFSCSLFIILLKPFGFQNVNGQWYYDLVILGLGVLFILSVLLMEWVIPSLVPRLFKNWTLGKALIWYVLVIFFIGAVNFLYKSYWEGFRDFVWQEYFFVIGRTLVIAVTVSFFLLGIYQYINRKRFSLVSFKEDYLITSQSGKSVRLNLKDVLYIKSNDNYVDIHFESEEGRKKILFRSSLKNVEAQIVNPLSPMCRCHRKYLINREWFTIREMTSRSMTICLKTYSDELPVSKQYADEMKQVLPFRP